MIETKEDIGIKGKITIRTYRAGTLDTVSAIQAHVRTLNETKGWLQNAEKSVLKRFIARLLRIPSDEVIDGRITDLECEISETLEEGYIATPVVQNNLVMQSPNYGKDIIIQRLVGINTYSLNILFAEIGTGATAPAITDTGLTAPTNRGAVGFQQDFGTTDAVLQFFFSDSQLANTTYNEFGTFVDGSATIGSGQIFNHALLSPAYTKVAGQDTTVEVDFSIS